MWDGRTEERVIRLCRARGIAFPIGIDPAVGIEFFGLCIQKLAISIDHQQVQ
jgi:hypothetical protein